ncbi:MAG: NADH-quinone oxidoreductase subunit N [Verrucomicrobiota bacterium]
MNLFCTPEVLLLWWVIVLVLIDSFSPRLSIKTFALIPMFGVGVTLLSTLCTTPYAPPLWAKLYIVDGWALLLKHLILLTTFFVLWMLRDRSTIYSQKELFILPLLTAIGGSLIASSADFIILFVALELTAISFYVLIGYPKHSAIALEAGVKYLIMSTLATAFFIYGVAFLYGATGSTHFSDIAHHLTHTPFSQTTIVFALLLILSAIGFKIAAVPFHAWAPDVYQGAPTPVTAFLAIASKAMAFFILARIFWLNVFGIQALYSIHQTVFTTLAMGSLILGSLAAIPQQNLKRLLGYSSIAHAGFLLAAFSCLNDRGLFAGVFYLTSYAAAVLLVFLLINFFESELGDEIKGYFGLAKKSPWAAFALLVAFMSLAGLPPTVGFFGKFMVLAALWQAGKVWLFAIALISALAGLCYYLNLIRIMYCQEMTDEKPLPFSSTVRFSVALAGLILIFGFWPEPLLRMIDWFIHTISFCSPN